MRIRVGLVVLLVVSNAATASEVSLNATSSALKAPTAVEGVESNTRNLHSHGTQTRESDVVSTPLAINDLEGFESIAAYNISPDGKLAALITLASPSHSANDHSIPGVWELASQLRVINALTGDTVAILPVLDNLANPSWSPDGTQLAYVGGKGEHARLWLWSRESGQAGPVGSAVVRTSPLPLASQPVWLSNGRSIVLTIQADGQSTDSHLAKISGKTNRIDAESSGEQLSVEASMRVYSSDGNVTAGTGERSSQSTRTRSPKDFPELDLYRLDLAVIDLSTGNYRRIISGRRPISYNLSPNGRWLAYVDLIGSENSSITRMLVDVAVVGVHGGQSRTLLHNMAHAGQTSQFGELSWSPDSQRIALFDSGDSAEHDCFVAEIETGKIDRTGGGLGRLLRTPRLARRTFSPPVWTSSTDAFALIGDDEARSVWHIKVVGGVPRASVLALPVSASTGIVAIKTMGSASNLKAELLVRTHDAQTNQEGIGVLKTALPAVDIRYQQPVALGESVEVSSDGASLLYAEERADKSPQLWVADARFLSRRQITSLNPNLAKYSLGTSQLIQWQSPSGATMHGALLLPAGYEPGKLYPLVVQIYGGSRSTESASANYLNTFGLTGKSPYVRPHENMQLLATRGYVVLYADTEARLGTPMADIAQSLLPGINKVVMDGIVDAERMGLLGHSYGGYSVLSVLVQTNRFKAAVISSGFANLINSYSDMWTSGTGWRIGWVEEDQGRMGGSLWQHRERFIENSPLFYLDRVNTPLLLMHGTSDSAVGIHEGNETFLSLRHLGKTVQYVQYLGEDHNLTSPVNIRDWSNRMIEWFNQYLCEEGAGRSETARRGP